MKIPDGKFSRLGHTGQAYYITQWYPKPAVFDANGWHAMPYLTLGEFYSEFGSFDVTITLPANYVVGATGILAECRGSELHERTAAGYRAFGEVANAFPPSSAKTKTLCTSHRINVHDFAWFADKRFIVRKSEVALPTSGRTVTTWALFTPKNAKLWNDAVNYVNESVQFYSQWVGDYPYDACTAVDGTISAGGGMEYPMITIIGNMNTPKVLGQRDRTRGGAQLVLRHPRQQRTRPCLDGRRHEQLRGAAVHAQALPEQRFQHRHTRFEETRRSASRMHIASKANWAID